MIEWVALVKVAIATLVGASVVVGLYASALRLLAVAGRAWHVAPAEFTDAITVISPEQIEAAAKKARKAAKKNPLSRAQKRAALAGAYACFVVCALAILFGIYLIVPALHR